MQSGANVAPVSEGKQYKLYYFPLYARGEALRMLMTHAGVEWEEETIPADVWPSRKSDLGGVGLPIT